MSFCLSNGDTTAQQAFVLQIMRLLNLMQCGVCVFSSADSFYDTFHTTADMMYFCQMMAVLEVVNPLLGLVKTGFFPAMIQVIHVCFYLTFIYQSVAPNPDLATCQLYLILKDQSDAQLLTSSAPLYRWPAGTSFSSWSSVVWRRCRTGRLSSLCSTSGALLRSSGKLTLISLSSFSVCHHACATWSSTGTRSTCWPASARNGGR